MQYQEIESQEALKSLLKDNPFIKHKAFQGLDFIPFEGLIKNKKFHDCLFMGCNLSSEFKEQLDSDNYIFPLFKTTFKLYPNKLYTGDSLFDNYQLGDPNSYKNTYDKKVYDHFTETNFFKANIKETLGRALHDHSIADAMNDFLATKDEKKVIGMMGGHNLSRNDPSYQKVAHISRELTIDGYLMISGGGPGAMEATHLGAWFADKTAKELDEAITILKEAPSYKDEQWLEMCMRVLDKYPTTNHQSLGIPTWLYGHEPPTPFATHIAKFFDNSIREDAILTIAKGGLIFAPGSAGTIQEIFQDATQNHYLTLGYASPMIFFGENYWTKERPVYPLLKELNEAGKYKNLLLTITDHQSEIKEALLNFYPEEEWGNIS